MVDMSDKLSFICWEDTPIKHIKLVGNIVGTTFADAEAKAKELETDDRHYELIKDEKIFSIIQYFQNKEIDDIMNTKEEWNEFVDAVENMEESLDELKQKVSQYIEKRLN